MTPEEKNALLQFTGQMYGESKKNDEMLVHGSAQLQPRSQQVKQQFEQVLRAPVQNDAPAPVAPAPAPQEVTLEQAAKELAELPVQATPPSLQPVVEKEDTPFVDPNQMEFDLSEPSKLDRLISLIEQQNKILLDIRNNTLKSKHGTQRVKNKKPQ